MASGRAHVREERKGKGKMGPCRRRDVEQNRAAATFAALRRARDGPRGRACIARTRSTRQGRDMDMEQLIHYFSRIPLPGAIVTCVVDAGEQRDAIARVHGCGRRRETGRRASQRDDARRLVCHNNERVWWWGCMRTKGMGTRELAMRTGRG